MLRPRHLETGETVLVSGRQARAGYLAAHAAYQGRLRRSLGLLDVRLDTVNIDEPLDQAMHAFLERRRRRLAP